MIGAFPDEFHGSNCTFFSSLNIFILLTGEIFQHFGKGGDQDVQRG